MTRPIPPVSRTIPMPWTRGRCRVPQITRFRTHPDYAAYGSKIMMTVFLAVLGLIGIICGVIAECKIWLLFKNNIAPANLKKQQIVSLIIGLVIGMASWPGTYFMGYPYSSGNESGRVVGIPFMAAFFDREGRDYVGPYTMPAVVANIIFWFFVPQIILFVYSRRKKVKGCA